MKKTLVLSALAVVGLCLSNTPAIAGTIATPYVAGSMDAWAGPNSYPMTETFLGSDVWTTTINGLTANSRYEFKVTDGTWGLTVPGPNSWLFADGNGDIAISYDGNTYTDDWSTPVDRLGLNTDPGAWTAVGDWQSQVGGGDWDNANANTAMAPIGGGIYELSATLTPGTYKWKAVVSGSWDSISWDQRSVGTADWEFTTDAVNDTATFRVDALTGVAQLIVPEPTTFALAGLGLAALLTLRRRNA